MTRTITLVALAIVALAMVAGFISSDRTTQAAAPTTQPDLAAENALLKKIIAEDALNNDQKLKELYADEQRIAELQNKVRDLQQKLANQIKTIPPLYQYRLQLLTPMSPPQNSNAGSFAYNGRTVYLLPLHAPILSLDPSLQTSTNAGAYQEYQGVTTIRPSYAAPANIAPSHTPSSTMCGSP